MIGLAAGVDRQWNHLPADDCPILRGKPTPQRFGHHAVKVSATQDQHLSRTGATSHIPPKIRLAVDDFFPVQGNKTIAYCLPFGE